MLGWVLKRSLEGGRDALEDPDDTQYEQPDTPGPVFAARAFKSALFGTPARRSEGEIESDDNGDNARRYPSSKLANEPLGTDIVTKDNRATPGRLPGILLTPGTAGGRRKRVSFGHDVEDKAADNNNDNNENNKDNSNDNKSLPTGNAKHFKIDRNPHARSNLFGDALRSKKAASSDERRSSRATAKAAAERENAHELSSQVKKSSQAQTQDAPSKPADVIHAAPGVAEEDEAWEEVDDGNGNDNGNADADIDFDADVTVDLNEPHSQSGRYWKAQFQRYQEDAKVEMSKLLRYKQLAKSYAKMKDAEAGDLDAKLKEEKDKVAQMEGRISELAGQIARKRMKGTDRDYQELISDLTRQTALAVQYRNQVKELAGLLGSGRVGGDNNKNTAGGDELVFEDDYDSDALVDGRRPSHLQVKMAASATPASPRTHKTLLDTQKELRRAREQVREAAQVKEEARRLKSALRAAEQRALRAETENQSLAADLATAEAAAEAATTKMQDLERRAQFAEDERRRKDEELQALQCKYDTLKENAKARISEAEQVLRRKNDQIAELEKNKKAEDEARAETRVDMRAATRASNRRSLDLGRDRDRPGYLLHSRTGRDDFSIKLDDLALLPRETSTTAKRQSAKATVDILEDADTEGHKAKQRERVQTRERLVERLAQMGSGGKEKERREGGRGSREVKADAAADMADADMALANANLRRRRGAEPLRPVSLYQEQAKPAAALPRISRPASAGSVDGPKFDLISSRFARLGETTRATTTAGTGKAERRAAKTDKIETAAAVPPRPSWTAADVASSPVNSSRLMLPDRAAAVLARLEQRRAERRKALEAYRDKENEVPVM